MMKYGEDFGLENGRIPSKWELKSKFPNASDKEIGGFYMARHFQDTLWSIQNGRLHQNWKSRGFETVENPQNPNRYHGAPQAREALGTRADLYDPQAGASIRMDADELDALYERGGKVIKMELPIQGSPGKMHRLVVADPNQGWRAGRLQRNVLEYIPGYNTRIYADAHFVSRVKMKANIDGAAEAHRSTVRTAATEKEAEAFQRRMVDRLGWKLYKADWARYKDLDIMAKRALLREKDFDVEISADARLSDGDRIQMDLSKLQVEGRMFFDTRQKRVLRDTDNQVAEVIDPIDTLQRTARMTARQVATEDLVSAQKIAFFKKYEDMGASQRWSSSRIDKHFEDLRNTKAGQDSKRAAEALAWWRYIRFMEGSILNESQPFRRALIQQAEALDRFLNKLKLPRSLSKLVARKGGDLSGVQAAKSLAFLHFITARPIRQLILQGQQHFVLQALDPTYVGKWQMDTWSLLSAMKRLSKSREDATLMTLKKRQMANMLGYSDEELEIVMREFQASGLVDGVDVHSYAGGVPKSSVYTPKTRLGQAGQEIAHIGATPARIMRSMGFDTGETFNVTASWLMAMRLTMKEKGFKSVKELDSGHWADINNRGNQLALSMNKSNAAFWQYGALSVPLQFLQFTHKWLLMVGSMADFTRKRGLGNLQFSKSEARKIMAAQLMFWGGAGFGLKEAVTAAMNQWDPNGDKLSAVQRDIAESGLLDYMLNELIRKTTDDPELNFAFDETFSPSQGAYQLWNHVLELAMEEHTPYEILAGPSGQVFSKYQQAWQIGQALAGKEFEHWGPDEKLQGVLEAAAAGLFAGYSDILKVRLAAKVGQWTTQSGVPIGREAKFEELVMKGVFGINPDKLLDYWKHVGDERDLQKALKDDAREAANVVLRITRQWGNGQWSDPDYLAQLNAALAGYLVYQEHNLGAQFYEQYKFEMDRMEMEDGTGFFTSLADKVMKGYTGEVAIDAIHSEAFSPEQRKLLQEFVNRAMQGKEQEQQDRLELFEREAEIIRGNQDGN